MKNQYRIKNLPDLVSISEPASKNCVDNKIDESSLVINNQDNDFNNHNLTNIKRITLNKQAKNNNEVITKAYVDQFHQENEHSRRHLGIDFNDASNDLVKNNQDKDFNVNKITKLDSITVNRNHTSNNELSNKKYNDDSIEEGKNVRFNQTLPEYLKVSVGNGVYNLTKNNKIQITDTTIIKTGKSGRYLLQNWNIKCIDGNGKSKIQNFIQSTNSNSPTGDSGAASLPPISGSFMYFETSSNNHGANVFCSFESTDIIQITIITFYYDRFSVSTNDSLKSIGRFRIQLLIDENTWSTQKTIPKNSQYSDNSTDWTLLNLDFTVKNYDIKIIYDQIDTVHADMCFSNITITHSVY